MVIEFPTDVHVKAAQGAARRLWGETKTYIWPSVSLAQASLESANWTALSGVNNGFGIKATKAQIAAGDAKCVWTHETIKGNYIKMLQWFANFGSLEEAYYEHGRLLATSPYYRKAREAAGPQEFAQALQGIYATGIPGHPYGAALIAIMDQRKLYQFDEKMEEKT